MNMLSESYVSSVMKSIKKECLLKKVSIPSDDFILTFIKLLLLNPTKTDTNVFATLCVETVLKYLSIPNFPSVATVKVQIYFTQNHTDREHILSRQREIVQRNVKHLLNQILANQRLKNKEDVVRLYHDICCYIILTSEIGDPTDNEILKETGTALKSVLSSKEIIRFVSKPISVKTSQLSDISRIVTGIKIYNKDKNRKPEDVNDFPSILQTTLQKCQSYLECKLQELEEKASTLIYQFLNFYSKSCDRDPEWNDRFDNKYDEGTILYAKSYIIFIQQLNYYLRILIRENNSCCETFQSCVIQLKQNLLKIRKTTKFRTAIPVIEIYPQFKDLSLLWDKLLEVSTLLNNLSNIVCYICDILQEIPAPMLDFIPEEFKGSRMKSQFHKSEQIKLNADNTITGCEWIAPEIDIFYDVDIQYSCFCIVTFVQRKGILVSGIKEYGLIKYKNLYYCFASVEAVNLFCQEPEKYIENMNTYVFTWPETIILLNLEKYFENINIHNAVAVNTKPSSKIDVEIQTDVHPELLTRDYEYDSSILQIRKRFAKMINSRNYRTHSVQTLESSFRRNVSTQTIALCR